MSRHLVSSTIARQGAWSYRSSALHTLPANVPCQWARRANTVWLPHKQPVRLQHVAALHALSAEDRLEITELCFKFDDAINRHDDPRVLELFSPEGSLATPKGTFKGQPVLRKYLEAIRPMAQGNRHLSLNVLVQEGEGGAAHATSYRLLHKASNPPTLLAAGTITDTVVKVDGAWKFLERKFEMDPLATPPAAN